MNGNHPIKNEFVTNVIWIADNLEQYLWEAEKKMIHKEDSDVAYQLVRSFKAGNTDDQKAWPGGSDGHWNFRHAYDDGACRQRNAGGSQAN